MANSKLYIDLSGRAGLAPKFQGDVNDAVGHPERRYLGKAGKMAQGIYNPLRMYGYMAPSTNSFTAITESDAGGDFTNELRATLYDSLGGHYWMAENGNLIWRDLGGSLTNWRLPLSGGPPISGTNVKVTDLELYQLNGVRTVFYSYQETATGGNIGRIRYDDLAGASNWLSAVATGGFNLGSTNDHFMVVADNGFMYVGDGNSLHKIDGSTNGGANGTATANVLVFPAYFSLVDGVDWRGNLYLALESGDPQVSPSGNTSSFNEQVTGVYVWDRQSTVLGSSDFIPMLGVKQIRKLYIAPNGELRAIVVSSERLIQIRRFDGVTFAVMEELGTQAYPGYRDSVTKIGGLTIWLAQDGYFYAHGSIATGEPEALYTLGDTTSLLTGSYNAGAVLAFDNNASTTTARQAIYWSGKTSIPAVYHKLWYPHGVGGVGGAGNVYSLINFLPKLSTVDNIAIRCLPPTSSGSTIIGTVSVYFNQSTTAFKAYDVTLTDAQRGYLYIPIHKPYVNSVQIRVSWPTNQALGNDDFFPSLAEVEYTPMQIAK